MQQKPVGRPGREVRHEGSHLQLDQMPGYFLHSSYYASPSGSHREIPALCAFFHGPGSHGHAGHARAFPSGKKSPAARQLFGTLPAGRAEAPGTGNGKSPEKPAGNRNGGAAWRKYSGKFAKEWHRSPAVRSTYRRGAFKSLCMDQRCAG